MNAATLNRNSFLVVYGLPALVIIAATSIAFTPFIVSHSEIAIGVTYDLTLSAPLLYLFLIRKTKIPKTTVVPFFVGGLIIASFIIPVEHQAHLSLIKTWLLPVVEIGVLGFVSYSAYKTIKTFKSLKGTNSDVFAVLRETTQKMVNIPIIANVFAFEVTVLYYTFFGWKNFPPNEKTFTYHKKSGKVTLFGIIIFLISVETVVLHILVAEWNNIVAWVLTIPSAYFVIQLFAHLKAIFQRPIEIADGKLFVRYGIFGDTEIDLENIERVEFSSIMPSEKENVKRIALLGEIEQFNTIIQLKNVETLNGFYGIKSKFKTLLLFVDDTENFKKQIIKNDSD